FNVNQNASLVLVNGGENDAISGFVTERAAWKQTLQASPVLLDENKVEDLIRNFETSANENSINLTRVSQRIGESKNHMVLEYIATKNDLVNSPPASYEALEISNFLASNIGLEIPPGTFPPGLGQTTAGNEFRIALSVLFQSDHSVVFAVAVVVEQEYDLNTSLMKGFTDSGSLSFCGTGIQSERQSFIAQDIKTNTADFLFVVDNSGSMSSYQNAVTSAADNFENVMLNAGLDFNIGIITTDSDAIRGGSFTNDINTFKNTMNSIGTSGDATETGIWFAEQSLKSTDSGSSFDGTVTLSGHPRPGSTLSVIILSDEPSQYTSRSGNAVFDVGNNLFVANGYRVYSIVNDSSASQYDELALVTGGAIASINNTLAFPQIMKDIAINAGGSASQFTLAHTPIGSTIVIKVNGNTATRSITDGWQYISLTNSIVFYSTAIPNVGDTVDIEYAWLDQKPTPPIALDAKYTSVNNQIIQGTVSAVDPNQDIIIEYAIVSSPTQGTLLFDNKGNFTYTPFTGSSGIDTFTFTARDKDGVSKSGTITFTLIENTPPQLTGDTLYGCYNEAEITNQFILSNAEDTDQISYFVIDVPTYGHVNISGDKYAYVADTTLTTVDSFSIRAFDGYGYSTTETFLVNVNTNCGKQRDTGFINLIGTNYTSNLPAPLSPHSMTYTPDSSATWSIGSDGLFSFLTSQTNPSLTIFEYETNYPAYNFSNTRNIYALVVDSAPTTAFGFESNEVDATSLLDFSESAAPWLVSSAQVF
ncbi:MAG: Ig-like domain-containing protein, partial [Gammaproteobacteria bacterium]|nr:Ig-like domain-containing protein [Gammaproteobacteria bacterium]